MNVTASEHQPMYMRKSETESICMCCFGTIRAGRYMPLNEAETIHSDICLMRPDSVFRAFLETEP